MTSGGLVTGYEVGAVLIRQASGQTSLPIRVPHAIRPGQSAVDGDVHALCGAPVQQLTARAWPPVRQPRLIAPPCSFCGVDESA